MCLALDSEDGNGFQFVKVGLMFSSASVVFSIKVVKKTDCGLAFENPLDIFPLAMVKKEFSYKQVLPVN